MTLEILLNKCVRGTKIKLVIDNGEEVKATRHFNSAIELCESVTFKIYKDWYVECVDCKSDFLIITIDDFTL